jgi:hypothetical protein
MFGFNGSSKGIYNFLEMFLELLRPVNGYEPFSTERPKLYVVHIVDVEKKQEEVLQANHRELKDDT